jgi:hypothetical protein
MLVSLDLASNSLDQTELGENTFIAEDHVVKMEQNPGKSSELILTY